MGEESPVDTTPHAGDTARPAAPEVRPGSAEVFDPLEQPGAVIGRYKLLERIGEGGFGVVYMAEQRQPVRRKVALKVLKAGLDTRQVIARFEAERQALALMDHENIAKVLDAGATDSGRPYFVMELVTGVAITEYCDRHQLTLPERLELFVRVCRAVQHAHTKGVIHRDLKPGNVLVTASGDTKAAAGGADVVAAAVPKVIDFGIAKATGQQLTDMTLFTGAAQMLGTPLYMSPEQAGMGGVDVDTRADVYSLGVLLYELLTGTTPVDKQRLTRAGFDEVRRIIREEDPPPPSTRLGTMGEGLRGVCAQRRADPRRLPQLVRGELDWIVMRALEKDRARRYETANALARDVERYLHDETVEACPPSVGYRLGKVARRHKGALAAVAGTIAALVLLVAVLGVSNRMIAAQRNQKDRALVERGEALARAAAQEQLARENERRAEANLAAGLVALGDSQLKSAGGAEARDSYRRAMEIADRLGHSRWPALAGLVEGYAADPPPLFGPDGRAPGAGGFAGHADVPPPSPQLWGEIGVALTRDGRLAASAGHDGTVRLWDPATAAARAVLRGHAGSINDVVFTPDAATLVSCGDDNTIRLWDVATGTARVLAGHTAAVRDVDVSADGRRLLSGGFDRTLRLWDLATGKLLRTMAWERWISAVAISPDARFAVSTGPPLDIQGGKSRHVVVRWDLATGESLGQLVGDPGMLNCLAYARDGRRVIAGSTNQKTTVWDATTGQVVGTLARPGGEVLDVAISGDDRFAVTASGDGTATVWDLVAGTVACRLGGGDGERVRAAAVSGDGRFVLTSDRAMRIRLWDLHAAAGGEMPRLRGHTDRVMAIALSGDGRVALTGSLDGSVRLWDVATCMPLHAFAPAGEPGRGPGVWSVAMTPDGRTALSGDAAGTLTMWDLREARRVRDVKAHRDVATSLAISPDGTRALSASSDRTIKLWDLARFEAGREVRTIDAHADRVRCVAFSPDGRTALSGAFDHTMRLWDLATGSELRRYDGHTGWVMAVGFSPGGRTAASVTHNSVVSRWDVASGRNLSRDTVVQSSATLAFAPDGGRMLTGSLAGVAELWDVGTGALVRGCQWHAAGVTAVAFCPDGQTVLAGYGDGTLLRAAFDRADRYRAFERELPPARDMMSGDPNHPHGLQAFARWHAFRGAYDRAAELFERARSHGGDVASLELARCYWPLGRPEEAARELRSAGARGEAPADYIERCLRAVAHPPTTTPVATPEVR